MKSLEIVNEHIQFIDDHRGIIKGTPVMLTELEQIKADLEVLEILRKCLFVEEIHKSDDDYVEGLEIYLDVTDDDENCDDFHKVKQWLEENDV